MQFDLELNILCSLSRYLLWPNFLTYSSPASLPAQGLLSTPHTVAAPLGFPADAPKACSTSHSKRNFGNFHGDVAAGGAVPTGGTLAPDAHPEPLWSINCELRRIYVIVRESCVSCQSVLSNPVTKNATLCA